MGNRATGGFANALETLTHLYKPDHVLLGRAFAWGVGLLQPIGIKVERHLFMYAMTGAGKTTALITILSTWPNSVLCIGHKSPIRFLSMIGEHGLCLILTAFQKQQAPVLTLLIASKQQ